MKKIIIAICCITIAISSTAQNLKTLTLTVQPNTSKGKSYISIQKQQAFSQAEAVAVKESIDFLYATHTFGKDTVKELTNMSSKSEDVPKTMQGTQSGIVAISWDIDLWNKCKTVADLNRMAGHITNNSFSYHAEMANNDTGEISYPIFIFQTVNGKRGVMYVEKALGNDIKITVKIVP